MPVQVEPPYEGVGLSQFLVLVFVPLPQVTLQAVQTVQDPQFPSEELHILKICELYDIYT